MWFGKGKLVLRSTPQPQAADWTSSRGPVTSMTTASSLDNFVMSLISYIDSPPEAPFALPPSPLRAGLQCCCQNLTPLPEDTALARRECGSTAPSSRVPHATALPSPSPTQKYHGKLHTCTTTTAKTVCTQRFRSRRQSQLSIRIHASGSRYSAIRLIFWLKNQATRRVHRGHWAQLCCFTPVRLVQI